LCGHAGGIAAKGGSGGGEGEADEVTGRGRSGGDTLFGGGDGACGGGGGAGGGGACGGGGGGCGGGGGGGGEGHTFHSSHVVLRSAVEV